MAPVCEPGGVFPIPVGVPPVGEPAMFACALRWYPFVGYGSGTISAMFENSAASSSNRWYTSVGSMYRVVKSDR